MRDKFVGFVDSIFSFPTDPNPKVIHDNATIE
jgi:hypothetical protein